MDVERNTIADNDFAVSRIAAAIGEPARARMLYSLLDGHARTGTELAVVGEVSPSTASVHLNRLRAERLVKVLVQGKHRYYSLEGPNVARALEGLSVLAGGPTGKFVPNTPSRLRAARTCYDHIAGGLGVALHNRFKELRWLAEDPEEGDASYTVTTLGVEALKYLRIEVAALRNLRRRFAYGCLDWSERQPHIGGALGAAILDAALKRRWVTQELDSRSLIVTRAGCRVMRARFGVEL